MPAGLRCRIARVCVRGKRVVRGCRSRDAKGSHENRSIFLLASCLAAWHWRNCRPRTTTKRRSPPTRCPDAGDEQRHARPHRRGLGGARAEIQALLESQMFGRAPARPDKLTFTVDALEPGGARRQGGPQAGVHQDAGRTFSLLLYLPARATGPVPVFVGLGFTPNQSVSTDPGIRWPARGRRTRTRRRLICSRRRRPRAVRPRHAGRWRPCWPAGSGWPRCTTATSSRTSPGP